jgi:hypothetical protein
MVDGTNVIARLAQANGLPDWWVEAVLAEYYPCRKFLYKGEFWHFDFSLIPEAALLDFSTKGVVIPGGGTFLVHHIRREDVVGQFGRLFGEPGVPNKGDFVVEGKADQSLFAFSLNSLEAWDPKLAFSDRAIVFDGGNFHQWKIAESHPVEGTNQVWWKSSLADLSALKTVYDEILKLRNASYDRETENELRQEITRQYDRLEQERAKIREAVWTYHKSKVSGVGGAKTLPLPPLITQFDSLEVLEQGYKIRTYIEPLLYRAAIKHCKSAAEAASKIQGNKYSNDLVLTEMEESALCIITCFGCLESYINSVMTDYCPGYDSILGRAGTVTKWFCVPSLLGKMNCFNTREVPFSEFLELRGWRNDIVHFEPGWKGVVTSRTTSTDVGKTYSICNSHNSSRSIRIVREMIKKLSAECGLAIPQWLDPGPKWLREDGLTEFLQGLDQKSAN